MSPIAVDPEAKALLRAMLWHLDPVAFARDAGFPSPDETQCAVLGDNSPAICITCSRQWGKSSIVSRIALRAGVLEPESLVLIGATGERAAGEMLRKCRDGLSALALIGAAPDVVREASLQLEFRNGSRLIALPGAEARVRGYSKPRMVIIDESCRVPDGLIHALYPMLSQSIGGQMILLSSAYAQHGFHYEVATGTDSAWARYCIPASQCRRFTAEWAVWQRATLGNRIFEREYECRFSQDDECLFSADAVNAAFTDDIQPLFQGPLFPATPA